MLIVFECNLFQSHLKNSNTEMYTPNMCGFTERDAIV